MKLLRITPAILVALLLLAVSACGGGQSVPSDAVAVVDGTEIPRTEIDELLAVTEDRYGPVPEPVQNLFAIQEAKLKLARLGADYLVYRGGRATVGPLTLGSVEVQLLRAAAPTAIYSTSKREVSLRVEDLEAALELPDAIVEARLAA